MGFLSKPFGHMENFSAKYDIGSRVVSTIDALIQAERFEILDQSQSEMILNKGFRVSWRSGTFSRGGNVLAAVDIKELPAFEILRTFFMPPNHSASNNDDPGMLEDMIHVRIDVLANAVIQKFEAQSPDFRRLS